MALNIFNCR